MVDVVVSAIGGDVIELDGKNYKFGTTWTMFGLMIADRIQIPELNVSGKCSTKGPVYCNGDTRFDCKPPSPRNLHMDLSKKLQTTLLFLY